MYEVEVKVRADHDAVRERLADFGARSLGTVVQSDTYYDAPHRDFAETDEALRVRRVASVEDRDTHTTAEAVERALDVDETNRITYKGPMVESASKTREEVELGVEDGEAIDSIFDRLDFEPVETVRKVRERYELDGYVVVLDDVVGLGEYVEVEAEAAEGEIERVREGAIEILERLGLDPGATIRTSYLELLLSDESGS